MSFKDKILSAFGIQPKRATDRYFASIAREAELDKSFEVELQTNLKNLSQSTIDWLRDRRYVNMDNYRTERMARLIETLVARLPEE